MAEDKQAEKSAKAALKELREQAKNGVLKAQFLLAVKLANGDGVEADPKEAEKWYRKAAKRDFPPAMNNLARWRRGRARCAAIQSQQTIGRQRPRWRVRRQV